MRTSIHGAVGTFLASIKSKREGSGGFSWSLSVLTTMVYGL